MVRDHEGDSRIGESAAAGGDTCARSELIADGSADVTDRLQKDVIFDLLTSPRRRTAICYLQSVGGEATRGELAEQLAATELGLEPAEVSAQQRKRLYISLYQVHLPRLADAGVIVYDEDRGTIELTDQANQLIPYILLDPTEDGDAESTESLSNRLQNYRDRLTQMLSGTRTE
jgi:DNA-binding transcriptional ArsR family regulator